MIKYTEIDLKECDLVEILRLHGGAKLLVKRLPNSVNVDCTFGNCEDGLAGYITIAISKQDYIAYACQTHLDAIRRLVDDRIPFD